MPINLIQVNKWRTFLTVSLLFFVLFSLFGSFFLDSQKNTFIVSIDPTKKEFVETQTGNYFISELLRFFIIDIKDFLANNTLLLVATIDPSQNAIHFSPGMRREEIISLLSKKLSWSEAEEKKFASVNTFLKTKNAEGFYYPGTYLISNTTSGEEIARMMIERFSEKIIPLYGTSTQEIIDINTAVKIASIIEREAGGKHDMRLISGIIWNRIFSGMSLDIDATLQYVKGTKKNWWPKVNPEDKFIDSPFNTYQNKGLTPTPIASPSRASIEAALNPKKTECLFYLHDKYRRIHCAITYKQHEKNIARYYGT